MEDPILCSETIQTSSTLDLLYWSDLEK